MNPISGYVEPERPSPFAGMSDEQKEHEAVKLANIIDRLHSLGVVKPGKLGNILISNALLISRFKTIFLEDLNFNYH